ncbi:MAG: hypothetical protein ABUL72_02305, partial [Armatimonadota bacterium]
VQKARIEQVRRRLEADVVVPAKANQESAETNAKAQTASIIEDGKARAEAMRQLTDVYRKAGSSAREVLLTQKLAAVITALTDTIPVTNIEKVTMIDPKASAASTGTVSMLNQILGFELVDRINHIGESPSPVAPALAPPRPQPLPQSE